MTTCLQTVTVDNSNSYRKGEIKLDGAEKPIISNVLFDSGSMVNLIPLTHAALLFTTMRPLRHPMSLSGAFDSTQHINKSEIRCTHSVTLDIEFELQDKGKVTLHNLEFLVVPAPCQFSVIIGNKSMKTHGVITGFKLGVMQEDKLRIFALKASVAITGYGQNRASGKNIYHIDHPFDKEAILLPNANNDRIYRITDKVVELPSDVNIHGNMAIVAPREAKWGELNTFNIVANKKIKSGIETVPVDYSKVSICDKIDHDQRSRFNELLVEFDSIFSKSGYDVGDCQEMYYSVDVTTDRPQPAKPLHLPLEAKQVVHGEIVKLMEAGILEEDKGIKVITSSFIPIKKEGNRGWRIVNDLRGANSVVHADNYQLPRIDDLLTKMTGYKYYCSIDCTKGFYSLRLVKSQRRLFTCMDPITGKTLRYRKLPMGSKNSPAHFQKTVNGLLLKDIPPDYVTAYIDDLTVFHNDFDEIFKMTRQLFVNFKAAGFKINLLKCKFFFSEVIVFGFRVSQAGTGITREKSEAFTSIEKPKTGKDMATTLGQFGYYRPTIPGYSGLTAPLINCQKEKKINWTVDRLKAWDNLIEGIRSAVDLSKPDFNKLFILETDASSVAVGAILKQKCNIGHTTVEKIIGVYSSKLSKTQLGWECSNRELLGVYKGIVHFRSYLYGRKFLIRSDSRVVVLLLTARLSQVELFGAISPSYRYLRYISEYEFEIEHVSGNNKSFLLCDLLSRLNLDQESQRTLVMGRNNRDSLLYFKDLKSGKYDKVRDINTVVVQTVQEKQIPVSKTEAQELVKIGQSEGKWREQIKALIQQGKSEYIIDTDGYVKNANHFVLKPGSEQEILDRLHIHGEGVPGLLNRLLEYEITCKGKYRIIGKYIKSCDTCATSGKLRNPKIRDHTMFKPTDIGQIVSIDIFHIDQIKVLIMLDLYSKYMSYEIVRSESGEDLRDGLCALVVRFGVVQHLRSDNAKGFMSQHIKYLCNLFGIHHSSSIPRNSRGQADIENAVGYFQTYLRSLQDEYSRSEINLMLALITLKWNTTTKKGLGNYSPYHIVYGRRCNLLAQAPTFDSHYIESLPTKIKRLYTDIRDIRADLEKQAQAKLEKLEISVEKDNNTRFHEGDIVKVKAYKRPGQPKKFFKPWSEANFRVIHVLDYSNSLLLEKMENSDRVRPNRIRCHMRQAKVISKKSRKDRVLESVPENTTFSDKDKETELQVHLEAPKYNLRRNNRVDYTDQL